MINLPLLFKVNNKTQTISPPTNITLAPHLIYRLVQPSLIPIYSSTLNFPYIICPIHIHHNTPRPYILIPKWGVPFTQLTTTQLESYATQSWLPLFLKAIIQLEQYLPQIDLKAIHFKHKEQPKLLPTKVCSKQQYLVFSKDSINKIFCNFPWIIERCNKTVNLIEFKQWVQQLEQKKQGLTIQSLIELIMISGKGVYRISLSQQQKHWILTQTGHNANSKLQLVYNGQQTNFDPAPLLKVVQKQSLLFILETNNNKKIAFWMAAKVQIHPSNIFGQYYPDKSKQSLLLALQKQSIHHLQEEHYSVGFGNEILMSIGKTDIVLSAFNCSNVSYFPCSYQQDTTKGVNSSQFLLGRQFVLKQMEVYRIGEPIKI